jgi:hypothetical protein
VERDDRRDKARSGSVSLCARSGLCQSLGRCFASSSISNGSRWPNLAHAVTRRVPGRSKHQRWKDYEAVFDWPKNEVRLICRKEDVLLLEKPLLALREREQ